MKKHPIVFFPIVFVCLFLILSFWPRLQEKKSKEFSAVLEQFRSDLAQQSDKDALIDEIIAKKNRFIAYGTYLKVPAGEYEATFEMTSSSSGPVNGQLQISTERGKSVISYQDIRLDRFPVVKELSFQISTKKEIEPRVLYSSGSQDIRLGKVIIRKVKGVYPWDSILYKAALYAMGFTLVLLSLVSTTRRTPEWKYYLSGFLFLAGCFLILWKAWISEDAFITLRHVDNLIHGYGPVFNISERVEGFTHPLWLAALTLFRLLGLSPKGAAVLPAVAASFAALYILFFKIRIKDETGTSSFLNPAAAVLIGTSAFIDFGTSGLETALSYLLLVLYAKFLLEDRWLKQPVQTGLIASLLILNRPDFGIFFVLLFLLYVYEFVKTNIRIGHLARFLVFPVLLVGGYQFFRMGYYAALLPNPFYAKSGAGAYWSQGFRYLMDFFQGSLTPAILILVVLMFFLPKNPRNTKNRLIVLFSGLLHGFFVIRGGGDFMHGRFLLPAFLLMTLSLTGAFDRYCDKKIALKITCAAGCLILFFSSLSITPVQKRGQPFHNNITDERFFYYKNDIIPLKHLFTDTMILIWKTIGVNYRNLAENAKMPIRIAYKNVGFTGFYAGPRVYVCDELGLNDPVVSRITLTRRKRPGHEKNAPFGYLIMRKMTFRKTFFPLWNQVADTKYGILWDLSPRTIRKFEFMLDKNFKQKLDSRIVDYLNGVEEADLPREAEFLYFLKRFWFPYAAKDHQQVFLLKYKKDIIDRYSESFQWVQKNGEKIDSHLAHLQGSLGVKKFLTNIGFALKTGLTLRYSPAGLAAE
jgi:arabinofuranosyltransferase